MDLEKRFQALLANSILREFDAEMSAYLAGFPMPAPAGIESVFFWSRKKLGPRYVASLHHRCLRASEGAGAWSVVATRRVYANHFFQASLDLAVVIPLEDGGAYLLRMDRARVDPLTGLAKLGQGKLKETLRKGLAAELEAARSALVDGR